MLTRKVLIVGCGRIAGGYDETAGGDAELTHAGAYRRLGNVAIEACVEPDNARREAFARHWKVRNAFDSVEAFVASGIEVDIASVCSPDEAHAPTLDRLLRARVRAVFCEKPLTLAFADATRIAASYANAGKPLAVNLSRRFNEPLSRCLDNVAAGSYGAVRSVVGWYGKGTLHNGIHMADLLLRTVGRLSLEHAGPAIDDGRTDDPTRSAWLRSDGGVPVQLIGVDHRDFDLFELQFLCSKALVAIEDAGRRLRVRPVEDDPAAAGHRRPGSGEMTDVSARNSMRVAIENLFSHLEHGARLVPSANATVEAHRLCEAIASAPVPA